MPIDLAKTYIYHITDVTNLSGILAAGGLHSDASMIANGHATTVIGYGHIKERRLNRYTVPCCGNRFVGEFVPFYFCPRSPMLSTINRGNTGRQPGCQRTIVHLVSTIAIAIKLGRPWAFSNGNAGSELADFYAEIASLERLDWEIIRSNQWGGVRLHKKASEFLLADFFPFSAIRWIGCHNAETAATVEEMVSTLTNPPQVKVLPQWYY